MATKASDDFHVGRHPHRRDSLLTLMMHWVCLVPGYRVCRSQLRLSSRWERQPMRTVSGCMGVVCLLSAVWLSGCQSCASVLTLTGPSDGEKRWKRGQERGRGRAKEGERWL